MKIGLNLGIGQSSLASLPEAAAPEITSVTITGTGKIGQTLTAVVEATGYPTPTYEYQWTRDGEDISGATSSTYELVAADDGTDIGVDVVATNSEDSDSASEDATVAVTYPAPTTNGSLPTINVTEGTGLQTVDISGAFSGHVASYEVISPPTGVAMVSETTNLGIDTDTASVQADTTYTVRATNSGDHVDNTGSLTVSAAASAESATFGAKTLEAAGGYPVTGSSISSGDSSGHWQISSGYLSPSATGEGSLSGSYSLVLDDASAIDITLTANEYSARTGAEAAAAVADASSGDTVRLRAEVDGETISLSSLTLGDVTLTQESGAEIAKLTVSGVTGLTVDGVAFAYDNSAGSSFSPTDAFQLLVATNSSNILVDGCTFDGDCPTGTLFKRFGGIRATSSTIEVDSCVFQNLRDAFVSNEGVANVHDCVFFNLFEDAITGNNTEWTVDDNVASRFQGLYGKRFYGTITGTITPGDLLSRGSGTSEQVIDVAAVEAGYVEGHYNNYAAPGTSETFVGPSGQISITSITPDYDGIHGDFFQPIIKTAVQNHAVTARRNFVYRHGDYVFNAIGSEQHVQGILAQLNGSSYFHSPVDISCNAIGGGQPIAIVADGVQNGQVAMNTVVQLPYGTGARIRISNSSNLEVQFNACDNNAGGAISDDGGNTSVNIANNVRMQYSDQATMLEDSATYPQTLAGFEPVVGEALDTGLAGALDTDGAWRSTTIPSPPVSSEPGIMESALTSSPATNATSVTLSSFTAQTGGDVVLVAVAFYDAAREVEDFTCTWGEIPMTKVAIANSSGDPYEGIALFELRAASWPGSDTGDVVATVDTGTANNLAITAMTLENIGAAAAVSQTPTGVPTSGSITPSADGSLVLGFHNSSISASGSDWSAGLTLFDEPYIYGSTATITVGEALQDAASLTCTNNIASGRGSMVLAAYEPAA